MSFGGFSSGNRVEKYFVIPATTQRRAMADPGGWKVVKGFSPQSANTVQTFDTKQQAEQRAKELARNADTLLESFDAAMKQSRAFDYR